MSLEGFRAEALGLRFWDFKRTCRPGNGALRSVAERREGPTSQNSNIILCYMVTTTITIVILMTEIVISSHNR